MTQQSFVWIKGQEVRAKNKVKALKFQLRNLNHKNMILSSKIKDLSQVQFDTEKSPITQLQENLHFDRRSIIEQFKPILDQEAQYIRNERLKKENMMSQSRTGDIQQKQIRVKQIEQFDADVIKKKTQYQKKKSEEIRQRCLREMELNRMAVQKKLENITELENEYNDLNSEIELQLQNDKNRAKRKGTQLYNKYTRPISTDLKDGLLLPSIIKQPLLRRSVTSCKQGYSPCNNANNIQDNCDISTNEDNFCISNTQNSPPFQRKKSKSTNQLECNSDIKDQINYNVNRKYVAVNKYYIHKLKMQNSFNFRTSNSKISKFDINYQF